MTGPITRDPNKRPQVSQEMAAVARDMGWVIVYFTCEVPESEETERQMISFAAVVPTVPRIHELLALENGAICRVHQVLFRAVTIDGIVQMTPNVYAVFEGQANLRK